MKKIILSTGLLFLFGILFGNDFPGQQPGTEIGGNLPNGYEPSGAVWHHGLQKLFLVNDNGMVTKMDADGSNVINWYVAGDLEGICIADSTSDFVYLGVEQPDYISEFNVVTGVVTRSFDLTPWMTGPSNLGLEALTFVPDSTNAEGGLFYAGLQYDGKIYVFELPIKTSSTSTTVTYVNTFTPVSGRWDISGLHFEASNETLYAIWDSSNKLRAMEVDCTNIMEWDLPGNDQEGITLWSGDSLAQNLLFIAEDVGKEVWKYDFNSELIITIINDGSVIFEPDPPGYYGSFVTLTAIPDDGNYFSEWSDDLTGSSNPETLLMDYDKNVTATFSYLNSPENVIINIVSDSVFIQWDAVPGATGYNVYSSTEPYSDPENWTLEIEETIETSWENPVSSENMFYYVSTINN